MTADGAQQAFSVCSRKVSDAPKADNDRELGSTTDELAMNVIVQSSKDR
jgi:hypothetical protein